MATDYYKDVTPGEPPHNPAGLTKMTPERLQMLTEYLLVEETIRKLRRWAAR